MEKARSIYLVNSSGLGLTSNSSPLGLTSTGSASDVFNIQNAKTLLSSNHLHAYASTEENSYDEYTKVFKGDDVMENSKLLELYIAKFENENKEFRQDVRETEKRMDERLNRIEDMISSQNNKIDERIERLSDKVDTKFNTLNDKIDKVKDDIAKNTDEQRKFWIGIVVTALIGIGSIVATIIAAL